MAVTSVVSLGYELLWHKSNKIQTTALYKSYNTYVYI